MLTEYSINKSILSRILELREIYENEKEGADENCKMCEGTGVVRVSLGKIFTSKEDERFVEYPCDCVKTDKSETEREIARLHNLFEKYLRVFKKLDSVIDKKKESMTLTDYENMFDARELTHSISQWLIHEMPVSLFFTGVSGSGKTTMLKILWQILVINSVKVHYFDSPFFESMCKNIYQRESEITAYEKINAMVSLAKNASVLLMDDHACQIGTVAAERYLEIFDRRSEANKTTIVVSNKTFNEVIESYNMKGTKESALMAERIKSRFERLCMVSLEFRRIDYALQK